MIHQLNCFSCGHKIVSQFAFGRRDECPQCKADVHACKNCGHYDSTAYNECCEPQAEMVREKERGNFCDYFTPGSANATQVSKDLRSAAEALFKKK